jgi:rhodanese-related sulfurtransferase
VGEESPRSIESLLADARARLRRLLPEEARAAAERGALLVDMRPEVSRRTEGFLPGAVVIDRNVLEWRLDPKSPDRIPEVTDHDQTIVLVCNEGYASSLAAATLHDLGLTNATDLDGGFRAWKQAGLPVVEPSE